MVASGYMDTWHSTLAAAIRLFAEEASKAKPDIVHIEIARSDQDGAAYSVEHGEVSQGAIRLFLACRDLYAALGEMEQDHSMMDQIREALEEEFSVYLDTNIISAMVREDLPSDELAAMEAVLDVHQAGFIGLYTSGLTKQELDRIPERFRHDHVRLFRLLRLVGEPSAASASSASEEAPALSNLRQCLSPADLNHVKQAISSRVNVFLTGDKGILAQRAVNLGVSLMSPCELVAELRRRRLLGSSSSPDAMEGA